MSIKNNKLIAEFLGCKYYPFVPGNERVGWYNDKNQYMCRSHRDLRFDFDWNWLMLSVEKIESIHDPQHGRFSVYIRQNECSIQGQHLNKVLSGDMNCVAYLSDCNAIFPTKRQSTYYNVVEFIKWYNENKI